MARKDANCDPAQLALDFSSAVDDRRRQLKAALQWLRWPGLLEWSLCLWVLHVETEHEGLVRSYQQLAENLWCGEKTVRRSVGRLVVAEVLLVEQTFDAARNARRNEYRLDWVTITRLLCQLSLSLGVGHSDRTYGQNDRRYGQNDQSLKEYTPSGSSVVPKSEFRNPERGHGGSQGGTVGSAGRTFVPWDADALRRELLVEIPELVSAARQRLSRRPAGGLLYGGAFRVLEIEHLRPENVKALVAWHRQQLSLKKPVCGDTEADLLLVIAAGHWAWCLDREAVAKNRVAALVNLICRRLWREALPRVRWAAAALDKLAGELGGRYWLEVVPESTEARP